MQNCDCRRFEIAISYLRILSPPPSILPTKNGAISRTTVLKQKVAQIASDAPPAPSEKNFFRVNSHLAAMRLRGKTAVSINL